MLRKVVNLPKYSEYSEPINDCEIVGNIIKKVIVLEFRNFTIDEVIL